VHAHAIFQVLEKYAASDFMASIMCTLADIQEKSGNLEQALNSLFEARSILVGVYSDMDKRTSKVRRNISLLLLKIGKHQEALDEMKHVEEVEQTLFGERSVNYAKTLKVIGTLLIVVG